MKNLEMFCTSMEPKHYEFIKKAGYVPCALGEKDFQKGWLRDNTNINISSKNKNYAELTFHYWFWKNYLSKCDSKWIGFCHYRKFWTQKKHKSSKINIDNLSSIILKEVPKEFESYDVILGEPFYVNQRKIMKFLKKGLRIILEKPSRLFNSDERTIKFHFDLMHGRNNLKKAIEFLDNENREDFYNYVNTKVYFHPFNMYMCKSKKMINDYYQTLFMWLEKCETFFSQKNLKGYDLIRIYAFLAERFTSYWFTKNAKFKTMNISFYYIRNDLI